MRVLNRATDTIPDSAVYIGRPSKWGNPYMSGRDGTRSEVIARYEQYVRNSDLIDQVMELDQKDLVCWCNPKACHGDVLLKLIDEIYRESFIER
jgi:uncharacterized protein YebE (UPF0316 family)